MSKTLLSFVCCLRLRLCLRYDADLDQQLNNLELVYKAILLITGRFDNNYPQEHMWSVCDKPPSYPEPMTVGLKL